MLPIHWNRHLSLSRIREAERLASSCQQPGCKAGGANPNPRLGVT